MVENTVYSGVEKPVDVCFIPYDNIELNDYRGRRVFRGEEYYAFDAGAGETVYVHIEDVAEYLNDDRLRADSYEELITLIEVYHDNYPVVM